SVQGLAIGATSRDDVETFAVGFASSGTVSVLTAQISASAVVSTNKTKAYVVDGAKVNEDLTGADANQTVFVAAGSEPHPNTGVAGAAALSNIDLAGSVGGAVGLMLTDNLTEASLDGLVQARANIEVVAHAQQDVLEFVAGVTSGAAFLHFILPNFAGSFPIVSIGSTTFASIGDGATVKTDGNLLVSATDDTDVDLVAGSFSASGGYTAVGMSGAVAIVDKDTQAWIGNGATVNAKGNAVPITVLA